MRKGILRNWPASLLKKETQAQVFSCEFCRISTDTFFTEHIRVSASVDICRNTGYGSFNGDWAVVKPKPWIRCANSGP